MDRLFSSFPVGSILGIQVRVHTLLVVLLVFVGFSRSSEPAYLILLGLLLLVLLLHELGHCLVARHFGIEVLDITLWPLGGMARMRVVPEDSRIEGLMAAAGPAVNFVLALLGAPVLFASMFLIDWGPNVRFVAAGFLVINVTMCLFNLLPMFPSDGGRILRALLARNDDWVDATRKAVVVGRVCAVLLGIAGVVLFQDWMLPLVALWLWWMGSLELQQVRARHAQARADEDARAFASPVAEPAGFGRGVVEVAPDLRPPSRRLSAEDIERLEKYRGRLRPDDTAP